MRKAATRLLLWFYEIAQTVSLMALKALLVMVLIPIRYLSTQSVPLHFILLNECHHYIRDPQILPVAGATEIELARKLKDTAIKETG
jgi:hypothetical protein